MRLTDEEIDGVMGVQRALRATLATRDGQISCLQQERDSLRKQLDAAKGELAALATLRTGPAASGVPGDARKAAVEARHAHEKRLGDAWQGAGHGQHGA